MAAAASPGFLRVMSVLHVCSHGWAGMPVPRSQAFEQSRLVGASSGHRAEGPVEGLPAPQRRVLVGGEGLEALVACDLRLVARDGLPGGLPIRSRVDDGGDR